MTRRRRDGDETTTTTTKYESTIKYKRRGSGCDSRINSVRRGSGQRGGRRVGGPATATAAGRSARYLKLASKPSVFFFIVNYKLKQYVTISQPIYCFKQNRATSPSVTPLGGLPVSKILHIHLIHAVGGANGSPWWGWLGVVLCFKQRKKMYYSFIVILRSNSFWFPLERT